MPDSKGFGSGAILSGSATLEQKPFLHFIVQCDAIRWKQLENWHFSRGYNFWTNDLILILKTPTPSYSHLANVLFVHNLSRCMVHKLKAHEKCFFFKLFQSDCITEYRFLYLEFLGLNIHCLLCLPSLSAICSGPSIEKYREILCLYPTIFNIYYLKTYKQGDKIKSNTFIEYFLH